MDNKTKLLHRLIALFVVLALFCGVSAAGLYSLQIINGEAYRLQAERHLTSTNVVSAARGEILDRYGRPLVTNESVYSIRFDYAYWDQKNQNDILLQLVQLVISAGVDVPTILPITQQAPYTFTCSADDKVYTALVDFIDTHNGTEDGKDTLGLQSKYGVSQAKDLDAASVLEVLKAYYKISDNYTESNARWILEQRYRMTTSNFSRTNPFLFAENVPMDLIAEIKERHELFQGVNVEASTVRKYDTDCAAQILGRTGIIYAEEWDTYKEKGYSMNDIVGKSGLEMSMEQYLRGKSGSLMVDTDVTGEVTGTMESAAPQPGDNVITTLDIELQKVAEDSLARVISGISGARGGAAVVVKVDTGEVLAAANYPTYSQATFLEDSAAINDNPLEPTRNRAFQMAYAPGSTFKPMIALAGLEEGVITSGTTMVCNHYYTRFSSRTFKCLGWHGAVDLNQAIKKSCNIYFYETGYMLGGATIEKWSKLFGFGQKTGIEVGEIAGSAAGPTYRAQMLENNPLFNQWQPGDVVQAAIGQSDNTITPLQLAVYAATLANGGTRYQPTLIKSVKSYDYSSTVMENEPKVAQQIDVDPANLKVVTDAMQSVADESGTAAATFANYPIPIAIKTGTSQHGGGKDFDGNSTDHGVLIAYAPADDPEIAVAVVGECALHGSSVAPVARDIFDAYFQGEEEMESVPAEYTMQK
ncbi:MAG TPA: hypothetical protein H9707_02065 [Candidatus Butyricicoccus avicola]|nr:hypothetical protein [Candidatus Butyricicoccus avicola]